MYPDFYNSLLAQMLLSCHQSISQNISWNTRNIFGGIEKRREKIVLLGIIPKIEVLLLNKFEIYQIN